MFGIGYGEADEAPYAVYSHGNGHDGRDRFDACTASALHVGGVAPQVGKLHAFERAPATGRDLFVKNRADGQRPVLGHGLHAQLGCCYLDLYADALIRYISATATSARSAHE